VARGLRTTEESAARDTGTSEERAVRDSVYD